MKPLEPKRVRISIFFKILFPLVVSLVLINVVLFLTVMPLLRPPRPPGPPDPREGGVQMVAKKLSTRLQLIESELGSQPSVEKATALVAKGETLVFQNGTERWSTGQDTPTWEDVEPWAIPLATAAGSMTGRHFDRHFYGNTTANGKFLLFSPSFGPPNPILTPGFWIMAGLQVAFVLLLCYGILAWQLRPIKQLQKAVNELSNGNLDFRVHTNDSGEFGELSEAFNGMVQRFSDMIKAKEELMLGVSHELRSPLASANVLLELIDDERRRTQIRGHLNRMESLISELLESHRIASAHAEPSFEIVSLSEFLQSIKHRYADANLTFDSVRSDLNVELDKRYFDRLLTNLIENALKYSQNSPTPVHVSVQEMPGSLRLDILDSGPGIPQDEIKNIFEPFYRIDKSRNKATGGFGLGLYLCTKITQMHGGRIWASNRPTGGACFSVELPIRQPKPASSFQRKSA